MATVAFLGTGLMGAALAEAAAKRGDSVAAWNRTTAKSQVARSRQDSGRGNRSRRSPRLTMARKDARLMIEAARPGELTVPPAIAKRMDALIARGFGADDMGILAVDAVPKKPSR